MMATSFEAKLPGPFQRKAEADNITPEQVVQRVFRLALLRKNPLANRDYPFFVVQLNSENDGVAFVQSFRNRYTALTVGRQMARDDENWGECRPLTSYFTFDIEGNWYYPPLSAELTS